MRRKNAWADSDSDKEDREMGPSPAWMFRLEARRVVSVSAGDVFSAIVTGAGHVYTFGMNDCGQLATGDKIARTTPTRVRALVDLPCARVACGAKFVLCISAFGQLWTWGANNHGQLGLGDTEDRLLPEKIFLVRLDAFGRRVVDVAAGENHSIMLIDDGTVWVWGRGANGRLGLGTVTDEVAPQPLEPLFPVKRIAAGRWHTLVAGDGGVYSFGCGRDNRLGHGGCTDEHSPRRIEGLPAVPVAHMSAYAHTLIALSNGELWVHGRNHYGQLGLGDFEAREVPTRAVALTHSRVTKVAAAEHHSLAITAEGKLLSFGTGQGGRLGNNDARPGSHPLPEEVDAFTYRRPVALGVGAWHSFVVGANGHLYTFGPNRGGQLGTGDHEPRVTPCRLKGFHEERMAGASMASLDASRSPSPDVASVLSEMSITVDGPRDSSTPIPINRSASQASTTSLLSVPPPRPHGR